MEPAAAAVAPIAPHRPGRHLRRVRCPQSSVRAGTFVGIAESRAGTGADARDGQQQVRHQRRNAKSSDQLGDDARNVCGQVGRSFAQPTPAFHPVLPADPASPPPASISPAVDRTAVSRGDSRRFGRHRGHRGRNPRTASRLGVAWAVHPAPPSRESAEHPCQERVLGPASRKVPAPSSRRAQTTTRGTWTTAPRPPSALRGQGRIPRSDRYHHGGRRERSQPTSNAP